MTAEVEAHLELCEGCDIYVKQMGTTIRALGTVPVDTLSEEVQSDLVRVFAIDAARQPRTSESPSRANKGDPAARSLRAENLYRPSGITSPNQSSY
jgi:hypothetical protein